jgi:hypothetical protein
VAGRHWSQQLTDETIAVLNQQFVPYAPAWEGQQGSYDWWKAVLKDNSADKYKKGLERHVPGTMLWTITSAGHTVPASKATDKKDGLAGLLRQVAEMYAQLPESERRPAEPITDVDRPMPAPPAGGLVLTIYDVPLLSDAAGQCCSAGGTPGIPGPQRQSLWLTEAEWKSLLPANPHPGATTPIPTPLVKRICLFGLRPATAWHVEHFWDPDSVRQADLRLTVEEVAAGAVRLRVHGSLLLTKPSGIRTRSDAKVPTPPDLEDRYDARVEGVLVYDAQTQRVTRWEMVVLGDLVGAYWPNVSTKASRNFTTEPVVIGFAFELDPSDYALPAERRRQAPYLLAHTFKGPQRQAFYWDVDRWLTDWNKRRPRR